MRKSSHAYTLQELWTLRHLWVLNSEHSRQRDSCEYARGLRSSKNKCQLHALDSFAVCLTALEICFRWGFQSQI